MCGKVNIARFICINVADFIAIPKDWEPSAPPTKSVIVPGIGINYFAAV